MTIRLRTLRAALAAAGILLIASAATAQKLEFDLDDGESGYKLLKLQASARYAALSGAGSALAAGPADQDANPALDLPVAAPSVAIGYNRLFARFESGIQHAAWAAPLLGGTLLGRLRYIGFSDLEGYDGHDRETGDFSAATWSVGAGWSRRFLGSWIAGARLSYGMNHVAEVRSQAVFTDFGLRWNPSAGVWAAGLSVLNWGAATRSLHDQETLPLTIVAGGARRLPSIFGWESRLLVDARRPADETWSFPVGLEAVQGPITLRAGYPVLADEALPSLGGGLAWGDYSLDASFMFHQALGWAPAFVLTARL